MKKNKLIIFGVVLSFLFISVFLGLTKLSLAQQSSGDYYDSSSNYEEETSFIPKTYIESSDVIGIRIIPNPNNYSIDRWYKSQGFSGSPQKLTVDGYEAIRDGRTVYVNAANIKINPNNPNDRLIYTNIYLISYNQDSSIKTTDILGQIIKNWRFNSDLVESVNPLPSCSISSRACSVDSDCGQDQFCAGENSPKANSCQLKNPVNCSFDSDCPEEFYCDSIKSKIIRDVKRITIAADIQNALENYRNYFGKYPVLSSGSYISGQTISLWPSWSANFLKDLSLPLNLADPINRLGYCPDFDLKTCWNIETKSFYSKTDNSQLNAILPANSYAFAYRTNNGLNYNLCANLETAEEKTNLNYRFPASSLTSCALEEAPNTAPYLKNAQLSGEAGREFVGWLEFGDEQENPLSWMISWPQSAWQTLPVLQKTNNPNLKKLYAPLAPMPGNYPLVVTVSDGRATTTERLSVMIGNEAPFIEASNQAFVLNPKKPFQYNFSFSDSNIINYNTAFRILRKSSTNNTFIPFYSSGNYDVGSIKSSKIGDGRYQVDYSYLIPTSYNFPENSEYKYIIEISDTYGKKTQKEVTLNIKNEVPTLNFNCSLNARLGKPYSCLLGPEIQPGTGEQALSYAGNFTISGLKFVNEFGNVFLKADGVGGTAGEEKQINISATNEYGASVIKSFKLRLNNYCGDGIKQTPNTEGRGGLYNDGNESCDINDGVTDNAASSSIKMQYGCATFNSNTPFPIPNNSYCVFKSPINGGGYCGDGYCQIDYENYDNCSYDCLNVCVPNCSGKNCGDDGCGGSCGSCGNESVCVKNSCCPSQATIQVSVDDSHKTYFNNKLVSSANNWSNAQKFDVQVIDGKNTIAIYGSDLYGAPYGISASLEQGSCSETNTNDMSNWKCINVEETGINFGGWNTIDYDDSKWPKAVYAGAPGDRPGNKLPYNQIWAPDSFEDSKVYCRYSFITRGCVPDCSGKNCGDDGCGGSCGVCETNQNCGSSGLCLDNITGLPVCTPNCGGKTCGPDGCGGLCGICSRVQTCSLDGKCVDKELDICIPKCEDKVCGNNGCGGFCGYCDDAQSCSLDGKCVDKEVSDDSLNPPNFKDGKCVPRGLDTGSGSIEECGSLKNPVVCNKNSDCFWQEFNENQVE